MAQGIDKIIETSVDAELSESFLAYSLSVIISRALPDVRDGLKPVHRHILFDMHKQRIFPDGPYVKCAQVVGDTMGSYHPHGDSSIYEALVRMTQAFRMRTVLIDPHGNFGSLDDGPAAPRYTECRLDSAGVALLADLDEDAVEFTYNYTGSLQEPTVLPAAFPNLLVNGGSGIAVGMASNMPTHNLLEVVDGIKAMLLNENITLDEMMEHIPGPDLPTGADIVDGGAIREFYRTGRGSFIMRSVARIENLTARKRGIVFTALPYNVAPESILTKVKEAVKAGKLQGVADIKNLSDFDNGMKIVVECKTGFNPEAILQELYRLTPLQESFGVNNVCIVKRQPQTLGLLDLCKYYVEHRIDVITRRSRFRLNKAEARAHILDGLIIALASVEEVIKIIRASKDTATARKDLMKAFLLSEIQTNAILEMRLARLTRLEVGKLEAELKELKKTIKYLTELLASPKKIKALAAEELDIVAAKNGDPRRSKILKDAPVVTKMAVALEIPDEPVTLVLNSNGLLGAFETSANKTKPTKNDFATAQINTSTRATIGAVTSRGRLLRHGAVEVPKAEGRGRGSAISEIFSLENENIINFTPTEPGHVLTIVTKEGLVKRVLTDALPNANKPGAPVIGLKDGDEVVSVHVSKADEVNELLIVTSGAQLLKIDTSTIAPKGAPAGGMAGIKLGEGAEVIASGLLPKDSEDVIVYTLSDRDGFKRTPAQDYPAKGRGGAGVRCQTLRKDETKLIAALVTSGQVFGVGESGEPVILETEDGRRDASGIKLETPAVGLGVKRQS